MKLLVKTQIKMKLDKAVGFVIGNDRISKIWYMRSLKMILTEREKRTGNFVFLTHKEKVL